MRDDEKKTPHSEHQGERPYFGPWFLFLALPELWILGIPGLITLVMIVVFGVPDEFRFAVFVSALIVVLMVGSAVAVYYYGRSFKCGRSTSQSSDKWRR